MINHKRSYNDIMHKPGPFKDWSAALVIAKISPPAVIVGHRCTTMGNVSAQPVKEEAIV